MADKISKGLRDIIIINQSIIENLKANKARADRMLDKYQAQVRDEAELPANRFLNWTRVVDPYTDSVISAKVTDYELIRRYEEFVKELVEYEQSQILITQELEVAKAVADRLIDSILALEQKVQVYRKQLQSLKDTRSMDEELRAAAEGLDEVAEYTGPLDAEDDEDEGGEDGDEEDEDPQDEEASEVDDDFEGVEDEEPEPEPRPKPKKKGKPKRNPPKNRREPTKEEVEELYHSVIDNVERTTGI